MYYGDIRLGDTIDIKFTSRQFSTGAPFTLAGTPAVSAYPGNSTTELTAGITLSVDFDSRTGLNNVRVVATSGNGYATATNYALVVTAGTVDSVSVVGEEIGAFSIENRSALMPTTAALTLDVSAGGEAGLDWANIGSKTTTNALTNTSIVTTQKVDVDTIKTNPVVNGGTITFPTTATLASTTNITAGTITTATTATNLTNAATSGDLTATMKTSIGTAVAASAVASVTGNVGGNVTGSVGSVVGAVGSVTGNVGGNVTGSVGSIGTGGIAAASFAAAAIDASAIAANAIGSSELAAGAITSAKFATDAIDSTALAASAATEIATAVFAKAFSSSYGSFTFAELTEIIAAACAGVASGLATTTATYRNLANTGDVIVATVDANGNRSAVTLTP